MTIWTPVTGLATGCLFLLAGAAHAQNPGVVHSFATYAPRALTADAQGNLYGMDFSHIANPGLFQYAPATNAYRVLETSIQSDGVDGAMYDSAKNTLYGHGEDVATQQDMLYAYDIVGGATRVVYSLPPDTGNVLTGLGFDHLLYATTFLGGRSALGTILQVDVNTGQPLQLYSFRYGWSTCDNGSSEGPQDLFYDPQSRRLYGVTTCGGGGDNDNQSEGFGQLYSVNPVRKTFTEWYPFITHSQVGCIPRIAGIANGVVYGTSYNSAGYGSIWGYTIATGTMTLLYEFTGPAGDGRLPISMTLDPARNTLYGITAQGGANGYGTIFSYAIASGAYATVLSFANWHAVSPLALASDGNLYGTATTLGGQTTGAVMYKLVP